MRPRRPLAALATTAVVSLTAVGLAPPAASAASTDLFISEYVEGSSNNKAIELYNGTDAPVDLTAGGYQLQFFFNGATTSTNVPLTGTVAAGDVFVFAASSAAPAILAQADQTYGGSLYNGDDAIVLRKGTTVVDSIGQVGFDPGTEWGSGLTSTADNTLRRLPSVTAGDTDPADAFDPAVQWVGFATDTFDGLGSHTVDSGGGPVDQPATVTCGGTLTVEAGGTATRQVTATDADDMVTDLAVTAVNPAPASGSISRTAFTPAAAAGGTATATVTATGLPAGSYAVTVTSTDADGGTATCTFTVQATALLSVGQVQGGGERSPLAPASGNGTSSALYDVRGVITQKSLTLSSSGADQNGFYLQSRKGTEDGDALTSDGIFVFMGSFTTLIGGYAPTVGDEVVLRGRVSEYFDQTQLSSTSLVRKIDSGLDVDAAVRVDDAIPPADATAANLFWERHEGERMRIRSGSGVSAPRHIYASTADSEFYVLDREDPIMQRTDPYARRVFRDAHPLDDIPGTLFDNGNNQRILIGAGGVKATAGDARALLPEARTYDTLTEDAYGAVSYAFSKYSVQPEQVTLTGGVDPSENHPPQPANRNAEVAVATYNLENLYDYRDDPFDGCDFAGNPGCEGVKPPFDYVPASEAAYTARLNVEARQIVNALHSPDLVLVQEAEDQDICSVTGGVLVCGTTDNADGAPDTVQELALAIAANGGPAYAAAYDRTGADARGITSAFLYRTDRLTLAAATATDPLLGTAPTVQYRSAGLPSNADVQNPKAFNAVLPSDVDSSTGVDGSNVYTRAAQLAKFTVAAAPGASEHYTLWAVSNHYSSGPDSRVGQRREQAAYGAALTQAIEATDRDARIIYGGDLNVFPRPDDPIATGENPTPSDQLGPLYRAGMHNLWDDLAADVPAAAYSYTFSGQAQTLDNLFVNGNLHDDLVQVRAAHINADYPTEAEGLGDRGASDHDPQVARFRSRASLSVADTSVAEGNKGDTTMTFTVTISRPLSEPALICATTYGTTASAGSDYDAYVGCRTLAAGQTSLAFPVSVRGDRKVEADEQLKLYVAGVPGLRLADPVGVGTILNDD
ncbi:MULTISPECIES: lamin tail domain-containing protein [Micromonospora]|uniref:Endonuclease n=1 Tax=Micromonospora solifontis TaxID=2487138 RepID=A0ABX9WIR9_9ACTN|nr:MULTISPECIES: lamin tail domain-containing protein [Micromonospora]NES12492.1 endonuclease [Micromonospora sp. PPF5-17B]NES36063.1 endonuclease [Micromonospora solifontis]NES54623.1 endonuclease [Micromonospora sp. PPF5-6]RNL99984.1 endonuclease [Micromonospora solifontis]